MRLIAGGLELLNAGTALAHRYLKAIQPNDEGLKHCIITQTFMVKSMFSIFHCFTTLYMRRCYACVIPTFLCTYYASIVLKLALV